MYDPLPPGAIVEHDSCHLSPTTGDSAAADPDLAGDLQLEQAGSGGTSQWSELGLFLLVAGGRRNRAHWISEGCPLRWRAAWGVTRISRQPSYSFLGALMGTGRPLLCMMDIGNAR